MSRVHWLTKKRYISQYCLNDVTVVDVVVSITCHSGISHLADDLFKLIVIDVVANTTIIIAFVAAFRMNMSEGVAYACCLRTSDPDIPRMLKQLTPTCRPRCTILSTMHATGKRSCESHR